jgi:hypothetical protein
MSVVFGSSSLLVVGNDEFEGFCLFCSFCSFFIFWKDVFVPDPIQPQRRKQVVAAQSSNYNSINYKVLMGFALVLVLVLLFPCFRFACLETEVSERLL